VIGTIDEGTLRAWVAEGLGDTEIGRRLEVSARTVSRARQALGLAPGAAPGRKPSPVTRDRALYVPLAEPELQAVHDHATAAGHTSTSPWVRRIVLEVPELSRAARAGEAGAVERLLEVVLGSEARELSEK
jgi:hypothetical protein